MHVVLTGTLVTDTSIVRIPWWPRALCVPYLQVAETVPVPSNYGDMCGEERAMR